MQLIKYKHPQTNVLARFSIVVLRKDLNDKRKQYDILNAILGMCIEIFACIITISDVGRSAISTYPRVKQQRFFFK